MSLSAYKLFRSHTVFTSILFTGKWDWSHPMNSVSIGCLGIIENMTHFTFSIIWSFSCWKFSCNFFELLEVNLKLPITHFFCWLVIVFVIGLEHDNISYMLSFFSIKKSFFPLISVSNQYIVSYFILSILLFHIMDMLFWFLYLFSRSIHTKSEL